MSQKKGLEYAIEVLQKDSACLVSEVVDVFYAQLHVCDTPIAAECDTDRHILLFRKFLRNHLQSMSEYECYTPSKKSGSMYFDKQAINGNAVAFT